MLNVDKIIAVIEAEPELIAEQYRDEQGRHCAIGALCNAAKPYQHIHQMVIDMSSLLYTHYGITFSHEGTIQRANDEAKPKERKAAVIAAVKRLAAEETA